MAWQLWKSDVTGVWRKGTSWSELEQLLRAGLTVSSLYEPLWSCPVEAPAGEMAGELRERSFDVAGVREREDGPAIGYVVRAELGEGHVGAYRRELPPAQLISDSTPLLEVTEALRGFPFLFVVGGRGVEGIVTRADLSKPVSRMVVFVLISLFELHLTYWIDREHPEDEWQALLQPPNGLERAREEHQKRTARGEESNLLDCLPLHDKICVALASDTVRVRFGFADTAAAENLLKRVRHVRNHLAHSHPRVVADQGWVQLLDDLMVLKQAVGRSDAELVRLEAPREGEPQAE
jgi:hypothetical protein